MHGQPDDESILIFHGLGHNFHIIEVAVHSTGFRIADVVTEFIEGLVETYPGLQYLDGFPEVKVVLRADVSAEKYDKVAVISGRRFCGLKHSFCG